MTKDFEDTSIFEGIMEFTTPQGTMRAIREVGPAPFTKVLLLDNETFIYSATLDCAYSPKSIYNAWRQAEEEGELG